MDPKLLGSYRLAAERRLHIFESRQEQELKDQYHYFMRKYKGLDHRDPVNSQQGTKHATVYKFSSLQGNKFHDNARITTEFNNSIFSSQEKHDTGANNRLHSKYKTKDVGHYSINICASRTADSCCHCLQYTSKETVAR